MSESRGVPLVAVDLALCLGTKAVASRERYRPWGAWQRGLGAVRFDGDALRFRLYPSRSVREIPLSGLDRAELAELTGKLSFLRLPVLRVGWSDGRQELETSFVLGTREETSSWARILGALTEGIDPELLREHLASPDVCDGIAVEQALALAGAIHAARAADHDWYPNWRASLPSEATAPELSITPTSLWAWRPDFAGSRAAERRKEISACSSDS